jgi:hypothetical protein
MQSQPNISIYRYSENPDKYWPLIAKFMIKAQEEGSESLVIEKYDPDDPDIETWMCFLDDETLISISAVEKSHYTNDPDIAARCCRYHILKDYRFTHCGLRMADLQIEWSRNQGFQILYITHDINNRAINALYQRNRKMPVASFVPFMKTYWYQNLQLEKDFLFKTGSMLQYVYTIRLRDPDFVWQPVSEYITRDFDASITQRS